MQFHGSLEVHYQKFVIVSEGYGVVVTSFARNINMKSVSSNFPVFFVYSSGET